MAGFLTQVGLAKVNVASPLQPVTIKSMAIGSGTGAYNDSILSLQDQKWIGDATAPIQKNGGLEFSANLPANVGGFNITEIGLIDRDGDLIAYERLDSPINKPIGLMKLTPYMLLILNNSSSLNVIITDEVNFRHNGMTARDAVDCHPISSITDLEPTLNAIKSDIAIDRKSNKISNNYTIQNDDGGVLEIDASASGFTITMPKSTNFKAKKITFVRTDSTTNVVNIIGASGDTYRGEGAVWSNMSIRANQVITFQAGVNIFTGLRGSVIGMHRDLSGVNLIENGVSTDRVVLESNIINTLTSTEDKKPLSAAQGKAIDDKLFAVSQTRQNMLSSRSSGTLYTNNTNRPIEVMVLIGGAESTTGNYIDIGTYKMDFNTHTGWDGCFTFTVLAGQTYRVYTKTSILAWSELR